MSSPQTVREEPTFCWPTFRLRYTFNPEGIDRPDGFEPDEMVVFDSARSDDGDAWLSAGRDSYVAIEDSR